MMYFVCQDRLPLAPKGFAGRQWRASGDYDVSVRINQYGLRDDSDFSQATSRDLFVVGDSFGFGYGVEEHERYSDLLENLLGKRVYNICAPTDIDGYDRLVTYAREHGAIIENLLISICIENDLRIYEGEKPQKKGYFQTIKSSLIRHSATYNAAAAIVHQNWYLRKTALRMGLIIGDHRELNSQVHSTAVIESSVSRLLALLKHHMIANAVIIVIPSRGLWCGEKKQVHADIHDHFVNLLHAHGLKVVDLRAAFEEGNAPLEYHFKHDAHWNGLGHRKAAEAIYRYLVDTGWPRNFVLE